MSHLYFLECETCKVAKAIGQGYRPRFRIWWAEGYRDELQKFLLDHMDENPPVLGADDVAYQEDGNIYPIHKLAFRPENLAMQAGGEEGWIDG